MHATVRLVCLLVLGLAPGFAQASDACSSRAVLASADVRVSDGSRFATKAYFHSRDAAAIRHISGEDQTIAVEGPIGWAGIGERSEVGSDFYKVFALGHQYHAFLLYFDEIVTNPRISEGVEFRDGVYRARSGEYPYGGMVHLVQAAGDPRPLGLVFEFPETPVISVTFSDWRDQGVGELPYSLQIDDGERVFDYRYSSIETEPRSPLWFFEQVPAPQIDALEVYRLHRKMLAAHCLGDSDLLAEMSAAQVVSANNGELVQVTNAELRERFAALFERLQYSEYHDTELPIINIAGSSDVGWIGVSVRALGSVRGSDARFDNQWAWIMTVRKVDGEWLHAGNASNVARQP